MSMSILYLIGCSFNVSENLSFWRTITRNLQRYLKDITPRTPTAAFRTASPHLPQVRYEHARQMRRVRRGPFDNAGGLISFRHQTKRASGVVKAPTSPTSNLMNRICRVAISRRVSTTSVRFLTESHLFPEGCAVVMRETSTTFSDITPFRTTSITTSNCCRSCCTLAIVLLLVRPLNTFRAASQPCTRRILARQCCARSRLKKSVSSPAPVGGNTVVSSARI